MSSTQNKKLSMLAFVVVALSIAQVKSAHTQVSDQPSKVCSGQYVKATIGQDTKLYPIGGGKGSGQATCSPGNAGSSVGKFDVKANPDFDLGKNPYCVMANAQCVAVDDPITRTHPQVSDQPSKVCSGQHVKATIGRDTKLYPIGGGKGSGQATCSPGHSGSSLGKLEVKSNPDFDLGKNPYCVLGNA